MRFCRQTFVGWSNVDQQGVWGTCVKPHQHAGEHLDAAGNLWVRNPITGLGVA